MGFYSSLKFLSAFSLVDKEVKYVCIMYVAEHINFSLGKYLISYTDMKYYETTPKESA